MKFFFFFFFLNKKNNFFFKYFYFFIKNFFFFFFFLIIKFHLIFLFSKHYFLPHFHGTTLLNDIGKKPNWIRIYLENQYSYIQITKKRKK